MSWEMFEGWITKPHVIAAIIVSATTILINLLLWTYVERRRDARQLQRDTTNANLALEHKKILDDLQRKHDADIQEQRYAFEEKLQRQRDAQAIRLEKAKRRLDELANERKNRKDLVEGLRSRIYKVTSSFAKAADPKTATASTEEVIELARQIFGQYSSYREDLAKLRGKIRRPHYLELERLRDVLVRICLDLALEESERQDPARLERLSAYRAQIEAFERRADDLFVDVLVPWTNEPVSGAENRSDQQVLATPHLAALIDPVRAPA